MLRVALGIAMATAVFTAVGLAPEIHAQRLGQPPGMGSVTAPARYGARSVEVLEDGAKLRRAPRREAERRGTATEGARLPLERRRAAANGCEAGAWYQVGDDAWICGSTVRPSRLAPEARRLPVIREGELLPHQYAFVRVDATRLYDHPSQYFRNEYVEAVGEGFGLVLTGRTMYRGVPFARTRRELWISRRALQPVQGTTFSGVEIAPDAALDHGWVSHDSTPIRRQPHGAVQRRAGRRELVHVAEVRNGWVRLQEGGWIRDRHLGRAIRSEPPSEVEATQRQRWIDIHTEEQVLVAYEGARPVYATVVSTGRPAERYRTPKGTFRIWVKLAFSDMDDLERTDVAQNYAMERVPWVQYFDDDVGLHAAFWHRDFGRRRSHGCVNLAPRDAQWLFRFTRPQLPAGWYAILPTKDERATVVRVR